jgi:hypothetical protein
MACMGFGDYKLNGWQRLGIVLSVLWLTIMGIECWVELVQGTHSTGWLTDTIIVKTGEPIAVMKDNAFRDLVPVEQVVNRQRFLLAFIVPVISLWALGFSWAWVLRGFRESASGR